MIGGNLLILGAVVAVIWIVIEAKRLKHKLFAMALIGLIIFSYVSAAVIFKGENIDFKSMEGLTEASKLYLSWLGAVGKNMVTLTSNAVKMDWGADSSNKNYEDESD